jgi:hypothetical protein
MIVRAAGTRELRSGVIFTSPRLRGEVGALRAPAAGGGAPPPGHGFCSRETPLTPTLSPQAGRGGTQRADLPLSGGG